MHRDCQQFDKRNGEGVVGEPNAEGARKVGHEGALGAVSRLPGASAQFEGRGAALMCWRDITRHIEATIARYVQADRVHLRKTGGTARVESNGPRDHG